MSTAIPGRKSSRDFRKRFISVCGTSNARVISDYLEISYQAAKNYLNGRLPEPRVLIKIAEKTPYSVHWLLTGAGAKFVDHTRKSQAELLATVLSEVADASTLRKMFEIVSEERIRSALKESHVEPPADSRTVKILKENIREEKESTRNVARIKKRGPVT